MREQNSFASRLLEAGVAGVFILVPFHAFFTAWLASNFGYFDSIRLWKEVLLILLAIAALVVLTKDRKLFRKLTNDKLFQLICLYSLWIVLMTIFGLVGGKTDLQASFYGLIINIRPLLFLIVVYIAAQKTPSLRKNWHKYLLIPAAVVIIFGLLQLALPKDFLRHFGYGPSTLPAFQIVDNKPAQLARLQSTLRGPNPLGAYLVPVIICVIGLGLKARRRLPWVIGLACVLIVLLASYSRSAWLGLFVGVLALGYLSVRDRAQVKRLGLIGLSVVVAAVCVIVLLRDNDAVQNLVFHTDEHSLSTTSSNDARTAALTAGIKDIYHEPFGRGVGSAGPASVRNKKSSARLSESYFLQIGQEAGIVGLALFITVLSALSYRLWLLRNEILPKLALASLLGLIIVNMVSHAWADDTLAYVFFGLVGIALTHKNSTKSEKLRYTKT